MASGGASTATISSLTTTSTTIASTSTNHIPSSPDSNVKPVMGATVSETQSGLHVRKKLVRAKVSYTCVNLFLDPTTLIVLPYIPSSDGIYWKSYMVDEKGTWIVSSEPPPIRMDIAREMTCVRDWLTDLLAVVCIPPTKRPTIYTPSNIPIQHSEPLSTDVLSLVGFLASAADEHSHGVCALILRHHDHADACIPAAAFNVPLLSGDVDSAEILCDSITGIPFARYLFPH